MIKSFASAATEAVWAGSRSRELPLDIENTARRKLRMLNNAVTMAELRVPPNNRLKRLKGSRAGQNSIRINDQWRIRFRWDHGDCYDVEIVDYR